MRKLDKSTAVSIAVTLCALTGITAYAYLGAQEEKKNTVKIAESNVTISEDFTKPAILEVKNEFKKRIWFENKKENTSTDTSIPQSDCFIRAFVDFSDSRIRDKSQISYDNGLTWYSWSDFLNNHLPQNWAYIPESNENLGGYFYYTKVLKPNDVTTDLITSISTEYDNEDDISDFDVIVYAEIVQTTDTDGTIFDDGQWKDVWERFLKAK